MFDIMCKLIYTTQIDRHLNKEGEFGMIVKGLVYFKENDVEENGKGWIGIEDWA